MSYQIIGIGSVVVMWLGLVCVVKFWPGDPSMSFSLHAAQTKSGHRFYRILFGLTIPVFYLFVVKWYIPETELSTLFLILISVGSIGQLLAGFIPATSGLSMKIHNVGAYTMAAVLLPLVILIFHNSDTKFVQFVSGLAILFMAMCWLLFAFSTWARDRFLYFQSGYIVAFHVSIIASTLVV